MHRLYKWLVSALSDFNMIVFAFPGLVVLVLGYARNLRILSIDSEEICDFIIGIR